MKTGNSSYSTWLGHANDMTIVDIAGKHHFFVVTASSSGAQLVKLQYDGKTYKKLGSYSVHLDGAVKAGPGLIGSRSAAPRLRFCSRAARVSTTAASR